MKPQDHLTILKKLFIENSVVKDAKSGYIVAKPFNLCIDSDVLEIASRCWANEYRKNDIDAIVGLPDAGARLVSILANMLGISTILPAKRSSILPGAWENIVSYENDSFTTGQKGIQSHIGFVQPKMKILVIDDVIARGNTAVAAIKALQAKGAIVVGLGALFDKVWQNGAVQIEKETGVKAFSLISIQTISEAGEIHIL
ncbi:MAG: phosphoribosyltransferase family protein [Candidatus Woesebacteria bacterium]